MAGRKTKLLTSSLLSFESFDTSLSLCFIITHIQLKLEQKVIIHRQDPERGNIEVKITFYSATTLCTVEWSFQQKKDVINTIPGHVVQLQTAVLVFVEYFHLRGRTVKCLECE